jgi:SAM-dependent methyltransferase
MTDWENRYQQGQTPWDKSAPAPELKFLLDAGLLRGRVLVPGCGRGHDARAIVAAGGGEVVGLDLAPSAVRDARLLGTAPGLSFEEGDLFQPPREWLGSFDWIWEHTCFCAIDPEDRARYATSTHALLRPGGRLLATFFIDPGLDPGEAGPPFGVSKEELNRVFGPYFAVEGEWAPRACFSGREGREWIRQLRRLG